MIIVIIIIAINPVIGGIVFGISCIILIPLYAVGRIKRIKEGIQERKEHEEAEEEFKTEVRARYEEAPDFKAPIFSAVFLLIMKTNDDKKLTKQIIDFLKTYSSIKNMEDYKEGFFQILAIKKLYQFPEVKSRILQFWEKKKLVKDILKSCLKLEKGKDNLISLKDILILLKTQLNILFSLYSEDLNYLKSFLNDLIDRCPESALKYFGTSCDISRISQNDWELLKGFLIQGSPVLSTKIDTFFQKITTLNLKSSLNEDIKN